MYVKERVPGKQEISPKINWKGAWGRHLWSKIFQKKDGEDVGGYGGDQMGENAKEV